MPDVLKILLSCCLAMQLLAITCSAAEENRPQSLTLGHENMNAYPWVMLDNSGGYVGLDIEFVQLLSKRLSIPITFVPSPGLRALETMKHGGVDGVFASSYKKKRETYGQYPMKNSQPDRDKRIHTSGYSLYIRKGSSVGFDGKTFAGIENGIGVQQGFSIIPALEKYPVVLVDSTPDPGILLDLLVRNRVDGVALQTARADYLIAGNSEYQLKIEKYQTREKPFHEKPYYIMLSHQLLTEYPAFAGEFWDAVEWVRKSEGFQEKVKEFYGKL